MKESNASVHPFGRSGSAFSDRDRLEARSGRSSGGVLHGVLAFPHPPDGVRPARHVPGRDPPIRSARPDSSLGTSPGLAVAAAVAAAALASAAGPESAARCRDSCERYVVDKAARIRLCGPCLASADPGSWAVAAAQKLGAASRAMLAAALSDAAWEVRWGAARGLGVIDGRRAEEIVVARMDKAGEAERMAMAEVALGASGYDAARLRVFLDAGHAAKPARTYLESARERIAERLVAKVVSLDAGERVRALRTIAQVRVEPLGRAAARTLRASAVGPADAIIAETLSQAARYDGRDLGSVLKEGAAPEWRAAYDRLLAVYARDVARLAARLDADDESERLAAVNDLVQYGAIAEEPLRRVMRDDAAWKLRAKAAAAVGRAHGTTAGAVLRELYAASDGEAVRLRAAETLGKAGNEVTLAAIVEAIASKAGSPVCRGRLYEAAAEAGGSGAGRILEEGLTDADPSVRAGAVRGLGWLMRSPRAIQRLDRVLANEPEPAVRAAAAEAAGRTRHAAAIPILSNALRDGDPGVRRQAAIALGAVGDPRGVPALARVMKEEPDAAVRAAAAQALGELGGPAAAAAVADAARSDADAAVRDLSGRALRRITRR